MRTPVALVALLLLVGAGCDRRQRGGPDSSIGVEDQVPVPARAPTVVTERGSAPRRDVPLVPSPPVASRRTSAQLLYVVVDPEREGETPLVHQRLPTRAGRNPFLRNDTLYAAADDVLRVLSPGARASVRNGRVLVNDREPSVISSVEDGVVYVPVKAFARQLGAYTRVNAVDGSATIWPRDVLLYWRAHGDPRAPVLAEAVAEGLIPPPSRICASDTSGLPPSLVRDRRVIFCN
jgi:hypothetical protein